MDISSRTKIIASAVTGLAIAAVAVGGLALAGDIGASSSDAELSASRDARAGFAPAGSGGPGVEQLRSWESPAGTDGYDRDDDDRSSVTAQAADLVEGWLGDDDHHEREHGAYEDHDDDRYEDDDRGERHDDDHDEDHDEDRDEDRDEDHHDREDD